ncbi:MAG: flagellar biosynthesis protein FlhF [Gammaproteobacteria bacterium]|nr:flagellar biosynthesis protein FlhF [Gammaproteobacteria bacterium]MDH3858166.1 flagellar biosynthesis protein FlhF [Gammaproteobacteria bacterium]
MRIKRTFAPTMRDALQLVKQEQGGDAVILGNNKVPGGVEILSAIDYDEVAIANMASIAPAPRQAPRTEAALPAVSTDVASDAWIGSILADGRKEPVLGPVAKGGVNSAQAPVSVKKPVARIKPKPAVSANDAIVKAAVAKSRNKSKVVDRSVPKAPVSNKPVANKSQVATARQSEAKPVIDEVKSELQNLRDLMESQLSVLQWDRFSQKHPVRTVLLNLMTEMGLGTDVCETVMSHLGQNSSDPHKVWQQLLGIIAHCIPVYRHDLLAVGGRIALVGSTGVGKTTTIAKLAARFAHLHGKRSVAMISTDQFRIGAQDQLQHFARLLEVPLLMAGNSEELSDRLDMLGDKKLVLIDTAGMSQRDLRLSEQFQRLQTDSSEIKPYLVLSANTQLAALNQTILNFSKVKLAGAFVTKLDEAASLGGIITASIRHQLALAYCGTGQKVPEDLETAKSHRLISRAVSLMQRYGEQFDQEALAMRYNHIINKNQA